MRLATFNVMHGRSLVDGEVDPERLRAASKMIKADVLGLQEVDHHQPRSGGIELTRVAAEAMGDAEHRFAAAVVGTPGVGFRIARDENDGVGEPRFGVSLISRLPVRQWHLLRLRSAPVRSPVLIPGPKPRVMMLRDEPRVALAAVVEAPFGRATVATTHLSFVPGWNAGQLRRIVRWLRTLPGPRFLLGDLNMPAGVAGAVSGYRPLARRPTFPSPDPRVQLDHIMLDRGSTGRFTVVEVATPAAGLSDHRPLLVEVTWGVKVT